jgi:hypothetical protein
MFPGGEVDLLRRAVGLSSRSAVAWKAAYMTTLEQGMEDELRRRCTARYSLLERLIGLLVERSLTAGELRTLLDRVDPDPARYRRFGAALADARAADAALAELVADALGETALSPELEECLETTLAALGQEQASPPATHLVPPELVPLGSAAEPGS